MNKYIVITTDGEKHEIMADRIELMSDERLLFGYRNHLDITKSPVVTRSECCCLIPGVHMFYMVERGG